MEVDVCSRTMGMLPLSYKLTRKSFILEGIATVLVATISYFLIWDEPSTATFLSESEKATIIDLLADSRASIRANQLEERSATDWKQVKLALVDWQVSDLIPSVDDD